MSELSRRNFLRAGAATGGGLMLSLSLPFAAGAAGKAFVPNAFVRIGTDSTVTVIVKHLEMGQGTYTGLPTLVAEELDADWAQIRVEGAPADAKRYNNLFWGPAQGTGGLAIPGHSFIVVGFGHAVGRIQIPGPLQVQTGVLQRRPGRGSLAASLRQPGLVIALAHLGQN